MDNWLVCVRHVPIIVIVVMMSMNYTLDGTRAEGKVVCARTDYRIPILDCSDVIVAMEN